MSTFNIFLFFGFVLGLCFHSRFRNTCFAVCAFAGMYVWAYYRQLAYAPDRQRSADDAAAEAAALQAAAERRASVRNRSRLSTSGAPQEPTRPDFREREGYMTRRARNFPWTWEKRFYQLITPNSRRNGNASAAAAGEGVRMVYYDHAMRSKLLGDFDLSGCVVVESAERAHAFQVITPTRKLLVAAVDAADKRAWMDAINHNVRLLENLQHAAHHGTGSDLTAGAGAGPSAH